MADALRSTSRGPRRAVRELLLAIGEDPDRDGLQETPARVARAYAEFFAGLRQEPADVLTTTFEIGHDELILVRDIEVYSTCEHHLVPFHGVAHVGYIPASDGRVTGLSKLARLVDVLRPAPAGAGAADHPGRRRPGRAPRRRRASSWSSSASTCACRCAASASPGPRTITSAVRGQLRDPATRAEAMGLVLGRQPVSERAPARHPTALLRGARRARRPRRSRTPRIIGALTYLVGLGRHRSAGCARAWRTRLHPLSDVAPGRARATRPRRPRSSPGILLLLLAHALRRRKRRAWRAAVVLLASASSCTSLKAEPLAALIAARAAGPARASTAPSSTPSATPRTRWRAVRVFVVLRRVSPGRSATSWSHGSTGTDRRRRPRGLGDRLCGACCPGWSASDGPLTFTARAASTTSSARCCSAWA